MDLVAVENAIITRLKTITPALNVESFPDNEDEYFAKFGGTTVLVQYQGSTYTDNPANLQMKLVSNRTASFRFIICSRNLKLNLAHQGIYATLEAVRANLTGYTPNALADATIMRPTGDGFVNKDYDIWKYEINFQFDYPEAEA